MQTKMKISTVNHYQSSLNKAVDYINSNLKNVPDLETLSSITGISSYHFHRVFKAYIGESPGAYVSRIRLEKAAQLLQLSKDNLTDIAELTGHQNQHALSKAFKNHFGINPSSFRNMHNFFTSHVAKDEPPSVEVHPDFRDESNKRLLYIRIIDKYGAEAYNTAWAKLLQYASKMGCLNGKNEFIGLCFDDPNITSHDKCRFYASMTIDNEIKPEAEFGIMSVG